MTSLLQVITLDMGLLVAGTKYRGEFEERLKKLMEEIKQNDDIILVSTFSHRFACTMLCSKPPAFLSGYGSSNLILLLHSRV